MQFSANRHQSKSRPQGAALPGGTVPVVGAEIRRIAVVGLSATGKSTLAWRLALKLGFPRVGFLPNQTMRHLSVEGIRARVAELIRGEEWVLDGDQASATDIIWPAADMVVWLDYGRWWAFRYQLARTVGDARKALRDPFHRLRKLPRNVRLLVTRTLFYQRRRRRFAQRMSNPSCRQARWVRHAHPRETEQWLSSLIAGSPTRENPQKVHEHASVPPPGLPLDSGVSF